MKNIPVFFAAIIIPVLLLSACGPAPEANITKSDQQREANPSAPQNDVTTLVDGNNAFALDLYHTLRASDGNLILSPYSISLALAMTYGGARGDTESQMAKSLHFDLPQAQLHPAFNALDLYLAKNGQSQTKDMQPLQLNIANAVWAQQDHPFQQNYLDLIAQNYGAGIHLADFVTKAEPTRREINGWVSDQTKDKINNLIPQGALDPMTRMVLVNAIYFKADWQNQFDPNSTHDQAFNLLDGSQVQTKMMADTLHDVPYTSGDGYQAIELPYINDSAAMDILVPDQGKFNEFDSALDSQKLNGILNNLQSSTVALKLPKFSYSSEFRLSDTLASLGMSDAFDANKADFSGMDGQKDLYISNVIHKAFVAVDEKGTEAAAATAVILEAAMAAPPPQISLVVDRPFIFIIRDLKNGQILFIGRVLNPTK
jgi:serpin B